MFTLVCGLLAAGARADEWHKSYAVGGAAELIVETGDGDIALRPGAAGGIRARVLTKGYSLEEGNPRIVERQTGNRVTIELKFPHRAFDFSFGQRWVHVEIEVPPDLSAELRTGDGNITARDVSGNLRFITGDGRIEAEDCSGAIFGHTGDGRVRASGKFNRVALETGDGSIELEVDEGSDIVEPWRIETGDGSVKVRVPEKLGFDFDLKAGDGSINVNLPRVSALRRTEHQVRGAAGGGGGRLHIQTGDGSISLARR